MLIKKLSAKHFRLKKKNRKLNTSKLNFLFKRFFKILELLQNIYLPWKKCQIRLLTYKRNFGSDETLTVIHVITIKLSCRYKTEKIKKHFFIHSIKKGLSWIN